MVDETKLSKAELLANIERGWNDLQSYLAALSYEQVTIPTDPAGWTAKDHLAHLAVWEDNINALLEKTPSWEYMGVDRDLWESWDWDKQNAVIQQRYKDISLRDLQNMFFGIHERLIEKIKSLSDADLQRPYKDYQPDSTTDQPIIHSMLGDTYEHYAEHKDYINVIVTGSEDVLMTRDQLLTEMEKGWNSFNAYLTTLSDTQMTMPTDAAGWTVKDHISHLAVWEEGIYALLAQQPRYEAMGITRDDLNSGDYDRINAMIRDQHKDKSLAEVMAMFREAHERLIAKVRTLSDEDLQRPYEYYQPAEDEKRPVIRWIPGNTFGHYDEHIPWIDAIAKS